VADLERLDGVVTGCAVAIAETGTVILDAGVGQGRRVLTLLPDSTCASSVPTRSSPPWPKP
jgi:L-lactate dehydrogenase complex protein LldG